MTTEVLVIDGDDNICSALVRLLRSERLSVTAASNVDAALDLLQERDFAVLICDQQLGERSGMEIMADAQGRSPNTMKILMVRQMAEVPKLIRQSPGLKFQVMMKPWSNMELVETVNHAAKRHHMLVDAER